MIRLSTALLVATFVFVFGGDLAWAQQSWPEFGADPAPRGPGFYFSFTKLAFLAIPFWLWVYTADWIGRDSLQHAKKTGLKPEVWNPLFVFTFFFVFMIFGFGIIPIFIVGYLLVLLAYGVPLGIYVYIRNPKVPTEDRVFTPEHMKQFFTDLISRKKKEPEMKKEPHEYGAAVDFVAIGGTDQSNQANLITSRQSLAFVPAKELIAAAIDWRADKMLLEYTADAVAVKYFIDGVWHAATPKLHEKEPFNREMGDNILAIYKRIAQLKPEERRARQDGKMRCDFRGVKHNTTLTSQGTPTGERVLLSFTAILKNPPTLADLGMREQQRNKLKEALAVKNNLVVMCSMPGDGLSASWVGMMKESDRLTRDFISFEDINKREVEVENVEIHKFNGAAGESPMKELYNTSLKQPEVYCIPELTDADSLEFLLDQITNEERKALIGFRAKEGVEAIIRLLSLKPDPEKLLKCLGMIVNQRLIRKLCEGCKESFPPPPDLLQKLGIPAGRVQVLYREKQPPPPDAEPPKGKKKEPEICPKCRGIGYYGRTAIYELILVDDRLREAALKQPKVEVLRQVARQAGNFNLQDEAILLLAQGVTAIPELQRVLK